MKKLIFLLILIPSLCSAQQSVGPQSSIVIPVNFTGNTSQPYTVQFMESEMNNINLYYLSNSFNLISIPYVVIPWVTINHDGTTCDFQNIANAADAQAINLGYNPSNFKFRIYTWPHLNCGFGGVTSFNPLRLYSNAEFDLRVVGHEFGHGLGLISHVNGWDCGDVIYLPTGCINVSQADPFDLMGSGLGPFNVANKDNLKWTQAKLTCLSGQYKLELIDNPVGNKGLIIPPLGFSGETFFTEYRNSGMIVHIGPYPPFFATPVPNIRLLDMHPLTNGWNDSPMNVNETFNTDYFSIKYLVGGTAEVVMNQFPAFCSLLIPKASSKAVVTQ